MRIARSIRLVRYSLLILPVLAGACYLGSGPPWISTAGNLPMDEGLNWRQADDLTIQMNATADSWNAGRVNDILTLPAGGLLVASDTGGVWVIGSNSVAIPLSNMWPGTNMASIATGPDGSGDVYAATKKSLNIASQGGLLFESDTSSTAPLLNWGQAHPPPPCGSINKVLVVPQVRRIVLACDSGVYWSPIPPAPSVNGAYTWTDATPANFPGVTDFSGLAIGPGWTSQGGEGTIVASISGGYAPGAAIYYGRWSGGNLQFTPSTIHTGNGNPYITIGRTSLASCASNRNRMFAVAEDGQGNFAGVWKSFDGGRDWRLTTFPTNPGQQGSLNQAIAISPNCRNVALGWERGTYISYDGGGSWNLLTNSDGHLHGDIHALTFDPSDPTTLYIGSDGGVVSVSGLAPGGHLTYRSNWNRELLDQQIFRVDGSSAAAGLVAAGLQDNGVVWAGLPGAWHHLTACGCDGRWSRFFTPEGVPSGNSILLAEEFGGPDWPYIWRVAEGNSITGQPHIDVIPVNPRPPSFLRNVVTDVVRVPGGYHNGAGQTMYAVGGIGNQVYGLFADNNGSNVNWEPIGQIGGSQSISAVAPTADGRSVFVGTDVGNIYRLDAPYSGTATQLTIDTPPGASGPSLVRGLVAFNPTAAYAAVVYGINRNSGYVVFFNGATWDVVGGGLPSNLPFGSIVATDLRDVYVSTGGPIYDTHDGGRTWYRATQGLPIITQGQELRVVSDPSGTYLYLSTFGRSLWRARLQ